MEQRKTIKTIDSIPFALGFQREKYFLLISDDRKPWNEMLQTLG
jgi:hypothetical protein